MTPAARLRERLAGQPTLGVVGLGYVGLPLAVAFAESGATVIGVDSGDREWTLREIPKVVGGLTPACRELVAALYARITPRVVPVSGPETAEMVKLFENTFRSVNIALVNEFAIMCRKLGISVWEVVSAAATKPFGFMPFWPGPGLGG